jgi:Zn-dependent protease with chaperone function
MNAMVAGFFPGARALLLSDRLLSELPRDQVAMVVLHEAAHVRRFHVPLRMLSVLPAWAVGAAVTKAASESQWAAIIGSAAAIALTMLILRLVAYRTEFDADVQACKLAADVHGTIDGIPASRREAAESLAKALHRVTFEQPAARKATWLHPGLEDRVDVMRRACTAPQANNKAAGTIAKPA